MGIPLVQWDDEMNGSGKSTITNYIKRKEEYFYNENKYWNKDAIIKLTGIDNMLERELNNF